MRPLHSRSSGFVQSPFSDSIQSDDALGTKRALIVHAAVLRSCEADCRARLGEVPVHRLKAWLNAAISE